MSIPSNRAIGLALGILGFLTRLPFQSRILYHWDSVNLALATRRFDISPQFEQPQPPGYILYVAFAKVLNVLTADPQTSYVWISMLASGLAVALCFYVGTRFFNRATGLIAALLLLTGPLFWFYGEVALPHVLDTALVLATVLFLYRAFTGEPRSLLVGAVLLALAGGVRPWTLAFLTPLYLLVAWRAGLRHAVPATIVLVGCSLLWFIPLVWISGGLDRYRQIVSDYSLAFGRGTSVFLGAGAPGLLANSNKLMRYTLYGLGLAALPLLLGAIMAARSWRRSLGDSRLQTIAVWTLPCLLFYTLVLMGQQGLIFVYLPAFIILSAAVLERVARAAGSARTATAGFLVLAMVSNLFLFVSAPEYLAGRTELKVLNWSTIRDSDAHYTNFIQEVRSHLSPRDTIIFTSNWRHIEYYLPEYTTLHAPVATDEIVHRFTATGEQARMPGLNIVLFDAITNDPEDETSTSSSNDSGDALVQLLMRPGDVLVYSGKGIQVEKHATP